MEDLTTTPDSTNENTETTKGSNPVTWSIRGVERDTRAVIEKAAERAGKTIGQYVNEDIRSLVQGQLTQSQLPAAPVDIQNQIDHLTKMSKGSPTECLNKVRKAFGNACWGKLETD